MPTLPRLLVLDADAERAAALAARLAPAGYAASVAHGPDADASCARSASGAPADVILLSATAIEPQALSRLDTVGPDAAIVLLVDAIPDAATALGGAAALAAHEATAGRREVVTRDAGWSVLLDAVARAARAGQDRRELALLRARVGEEARQALVGSSPAMELVRELVGRAAGSRRTLLVSGEAGTGKSTVARMVHDLSERAARPFVIARCEGVDATTLEGELFAPGDAGLLDIARGGTLVLDEARALPRALLDRIVRVVASRPEADVAGDAPADVRLVLTVRTSAGDPSLDVRALLGDGAAPPIDLPPLRERRRDIPQLVQHFRSRHARERGTAVPPLGPETMTPLLAHDWPGNVRELEHWMDRIALATSGTARDTGRTPPAPGTEFAPVDAARLTLAALERRYILHVLAREGGHQSRAAQRLGIDRRTLYRKLKEYRESADPVRIAG